MNLQNKVRLIAGTVLMLTVLISVVLAQDRSTKQSSTACAVTISFPGNDARVEESGDVRGTARDTPVGSHLWVLAHRKGLALWWPQGGGEVSVPEGGREWVASVTYGQDRDRGRQFEVIAMVVDDPTHAMLSRWISRAESTGSYPGITLPRAHDECKTPAPRAIVTRN